MNGYSYLTLEQRREIERMYAEGERVVDIAAHLKRSTAAIYEELKRGYTGELDGYARPKYSADIAQATAQKNFRRRGNRRTAGRKGRSKNENGRDICERNKKAGKWRR